MIEVLNPLNEYLYQKIEEKDPLILNLEAYAKEHKVPIITKEVAEYLKLILSMKTFENALEIGTAIGYSGILIAQRIQGRLTTIEIEETRYEEAKQNFEKANVKNVRQILGDAAIEIPKLEDHYDFIFIDASKGQYQNFFTEAYPKLNPGGLVFIDNILFRGYVSLPEEEVPKRYKTLVRKLDSFITMLYQNYEFCLLPFGDGIGLIHKPFVKNIISNKESE